VCWRSNRRRATPRHRAKRLAANALRQAEILHCALGDDDGSVDFVIPLVTSACSDTGTAHIGPAAAGHETLRVALRRLDALVGERRFERIDLIKIDVEGHERHVLDGDRAAIHDRLTGLGYRMLGILLDHGMADADWPAYRDAAPPFAYGQAHNLLLAPE
jgi:FkbM family methyltransferase